MKLIVGLGNPGKKYEQTRHNTGWLILDWLLETWSIKHGTWNTKFSSKILETEVNNQKVLFVKPQTFMNNSGQAVKQICDFYKLDVKNNLLIIHDDSDLQLGTVRTANSSSSAGHNGVQDIIEMLGTQDFHRIRIGVNARISRDEMPTDVFVLQNFTADELKKLQEEIFPQVKLEIQKFPELDNLITSDSHTKEKNA
ncbi:MAG: aminoacyl-tRNA hydrolase [Candidatus Doudnabacteria bacterium]|nr:aminoacyl-tRNA hydrolase [Candidatus Doudnabacteria bacterium]